MAILFVSGNGYAENTSNPPLPKTPYDEELYTLGYEVFLANRNPADAFLIAEKAVLARPRDYQWRLRAAQSGEWSGHSDRALEHWFVIAEETQKKDAITNALRLARALNDGKRLKQLLEKQGANKKLDLLREYVAVCEIAGAPFEAISALEYHRGGPEHPFVLEQLARLYEAVGRDREAIATRIDLVSIRGQRGSEILHTASLAGEKGGLQAAYQVMNMGRTLPASEHEFWMAYGDHAWNLQDLPTFILAANRLIESGKAREVDYYRLIITLRESEPQKAYELALKSWRQFRNGSNLTLLLELGVEQKRMQELQTVMAEAERIGTFNKIKKSAYFWTLVAQVHRGNGNLEDSIHMYHHALDCEPKNSAFAVGYIGWLLDLQHPAELQRTLKAWHGREHTMPELVEPFASAFAYLGDYQRAVELFRHIYEKKKNQSAWLLVYADTLDNAGYTEEALTERVRAMSIDQQKHDPLPDWQIRTLYGTHPGWVRLHHALREQSHIVFWDSNVSLAIPISKHFLLRLDGSYEELQTRENRPWGQIPEKIQSIQAGLSLRLPWGTTDVLAGVRDGLSPHLMVSLLSVLKLGGRSSLIFQARIGAPATETIPLEIGGLKDEASLASYNSLSTRFSFLVRGSGRILRDQERREIGKGASFVGELTYALTLSWPDLNLRGFGGYHPYKQTALPSGRSLAMISASEINGGSYFVPPTFYDTGVGLNFGQRGRHNHIQHWRPFGAVDLIWNSQSHLGYRGELGLVGPILGLDAFELFLAQDSGAFGRSERNSRFELRYRLNY